MPIQEAVLVDAGSFGRIQVVGKHCGNGALDAVREVVEVDLPGKLQTLRQEYQHLVPALTENPAGS